MSGRLRPSVTPCALALAVVVSGCSDDSKRPNVEELPVCNLLVNDGPLVGWDRVFEAAPAAEGGTIEDGAYELGAIMLYTPTGSPLPAEWVNAVATISGSTMQQIVKRNGDENTYTSTLTTSGTDLTLTDTCPEEVVQERRYTATATELRVFWGEEDKDVLEVTFRKR